MELEISAGTLKKILGWAIALLVLAAAAVWGWPKVSGQVAGLLHRATPTPSDPAQVAAVEGVEAFFSLDAQKGVDAWVERMCALTTQEGCAIYQVMLKKWAQQQMSAHPDLHNQATVEEVEFVGETAKADATYRLYRVVVRFSQPWDGVEGLKGDTLTAYALVQKDDNAWRFAGPLDEQDAQRYMPKQ